MLKILIVEDESNLRLAIKKALTYEGFEVIQASDGIEGYDLFLSQHFDLIITDVMMPNLDGNQLSHLIRQVNQDIPIITLTALEHIDDKEKSFSSGVDDYLVKPIIIKELVLRIKALMRRFKINSEQVIKHQNTSLDYKTQTLRINGKKINLTKKEFRLLFTLMSNPDVIFSREQLLNEHWGFDAAVIDRTVDTHISWLREKTTDGDFEIVTVWGLGYKVVLT